MKRSASPFEPAASEQLRGGSFSTLTPTDPESSHVPLRRSKRVKTKHDAVQLTTADLTTLVKVEDTSEETELQLVDSAPPSKGSSAKRKPSARVKKEGSVSPKKQKLIVQALETPHPTPARWSEAYNAIKEMRERIVAPVDTMGCNRAQLEETIPQVSVIIQLLVDIAQIVAPLSESAFRYVNFAYAVVADKRRNHLRGRWESACSGRGKLER